LDLKVLQNKGLGILPSYYWGAIRIGDGLKKVLGESFSRGLDGTRKDLFARFFRER